jgi:2-polyprenyl-6-methoxyphenol hydroxylase-like FAD-dependent oxidoreductase
MFGKDKPAVLIAGAGPVGQFAALCLARRGIPVQVVDDEWRPAGRSYALALHPGSLALLHQVELLDEVLEAAVRIDRIAFFDRSTRQAEADLSRLDTPYPFVAVLRQDRFERFLEKALEKAGVQVHWSHRFARFTQEEDHVVASIEKLTKESVGYAVARTEWMVQKASDVEVPFVLGTDGHHSLVRRQLGIEFPEVREVQHFAVFELETDAELDGEMSIVLDDRSSNVLWPLPEGYCRFSFEIPETSVPDSSRVKDRLVYQLGASPFPALETEMIESLIQERAPWFRGRVGDVRWRMAVRFESRLAESFGRHRIWLAGDAVHVTRPVGVQSMNVGLREAAELAEKVARIVRDGAPLEELERYGSDRVTEWRELLGLSGGLEPASGAGDWIRKRAGRILPCLPASGPELAQLAGQLGLELPRTEAAKSGT